MHLIIEHAFDAAVTVGAIDLTDPAGGHVRHVYGWSMRAGRTHVTRHDGQQWLPGSYTIAVDATLLDGSFATYEGTLTVEPIEKATPGASLPASRAPTSGVTGSNGQSAS